MDYRQLGGAGFRVPVPSLRTGKVGGSTERFKAEGRAIPSSFISCTGSTR